MLVSDHNHEFICICSGFEMSVYITNSAMLSFADANVVYMPILIPLSLVSCYKLNSSSAWHKAAILSFSQMPMLCTSPSLIPGLGSV